MFLKTLDEKQKIIWKIWMEFWKIVWHSDLHGKKTLIHQLTKEPFLQL